MRSSLCFGVLLLSCASAARASDVTYSASSGPLAIGASTTVTLPKFDSTLGVLRQVHIEASSSVSGTWSVENTNAGASGFGGYASGQYVGAIVPVTLPSGGGLGPNPGFVPDHIALAAFDGTIDYAGPSGVTLTFTNVYGDGAPVQSGDEYTDNGLPVYIGVGTIGVNVGAVIQYGPSGLPAGLQSTTSIAADTAISVRYTYDALPARICRAAGFSGCPCGNPSAAYNGCANSVNAAGGALDVSGTASIGADTLVLAGSGMTNSSALYFQGTSFGYVQVVYGDGLRCVNGALVRIGTKTNVSGASQYPLAGDLAISARGGIAVPGTRTYQAVYRDNGSFCTASHFNTTNGFAILWSP